MDIVESSSASKGRASRHNHHLALSLAYSRKYISRGTGWKEDIGRSVRIAEGATRLIIVHSDYIVSGLMDYALLDL